MTFMSFNKALVVSNFYVETRIFSQRQFKLLTKIYFVIFQDLLFGEKSVLIHQQNPQILPKAATGGVLLKKGVPKNFTKFT